MRIVRLVLALACLVALGACSGEGDTFGRLGPMAFAEMVDDPATVVLDVRTPLEYSTGHIPQAISADVNAAGFADQLKALDKTRQYAVYCRTGIRSQTAMKIMKDAGFDKVVDLIGGIEAWEEAGFAITEH